MLPGSHSRFFFKNLLEGLRVEWPSKKYNFSDRAKPNPREPAEIFAFFRFFHLFERKLIKKIENFDFSKFSDFVIFFGFRCQSLSAFLVGLKLIDRLFLPANLYFRSSSFRKWTQIEIWTDETSPIFNFKTILSSICRRPHFFNFPALRITLRVGITILLYESLRLLI